MKVLFMGENQKVHRKEHHSFDGLESPERRLVESGSGKNLLLLFTIRNHQLIDVGVFHFSVPQETASEYPHPKSRTCELFKLSSM